MADKEESCAGGEEILNSGQNRLSFLAARDGQWQLGAKGFLGNISKINSILVL